MKFFSTNKFIIILYFILIIPSIIFGQNKKEPPCSVKEAYQFDFWIGKWDLHWTTKSGKTAYDKNEIKSFLDGCVIHENYTTIDAYPFVGKSYSVYNISKKQWEQTWVDNSGGYMTFTGEFKNGKMMLSRNVHGKDGKQIIQRMVFYNISKDKIDWDWEMSKDKGKTWNLKWRIYYKRHKKS
ncbi:MAG: hypothetical protein IIA48_04360 [Bacteroidetes bacterium]|nr:hypothetical protein [Bacteroidota bacterium]